MAEAQIPHGYKQTEVGVIPEEWEVRRLSEGIKLLWAITSLPNIAIPTAMGFPTSRGRLISPKALFSTLSTQRNLEQAVMRTTF